MAISINKKYKDITDYRNYMDKLVVLKPDSLKEEYRELKHLTVKIICDGGLWNVMCKSLVDDSEFKVQRWEIKNVIKSELENEFINKYILG